MTNDYCVSREFMRTPAPGVIDRRDAVGLIVDRPVVYHAALLEYEISPRRKAGRASGRRRSGADRSR